MINIHVYDCDVSDVVDMSIRLVLENSHLIKVFRYDYNITDMIRTNVRYDIGKFIYD